MGFIDLWSAIHFCLWSFIGSQVAALKDPPLRIHWLYTALLGYTWEAFEFFASRHWPAAWQGRIEPWYNAWISDMIFNLAGVTFGWFVASYYRKKYKW